jgi:hypothetical protein
MGWSMAAYPANDSRPLNLARLGAVDATTSGTYNLDAFQSRRLSFI